MRFCCKTLITICFVFSGFLDDALRKDKSASLKKLKDDLKAFASSKGHTLETRDAGMKAREKKVVTKSFHAAGIVVPVDEHEVGYRELPETDGEILVNNIYCRFINFTRFLFRKWPSICEVPKYNGI